MKRYRIAIVERDTMLGEVKKTYAVQIRVFFFFWVSVSHCDSLSQARYYIGFVSKRKHDRVLRIIKD